MTVLVTTVDGVFSLSGDVPELVLAHLCSVYGDSSVEIIDEYSQARAPVRCRLSTGAEITLSTT